MTQTLSGKEMTSINRSHNINLMKINEGLIELYASSDINNSKKKKFIEGGPKQHPHEETDIKPQAILKEPKTGI